MGGGEMYHLSRNRDSPWISPQPSQPLSCPPQFPAHTPILLCLSPIPPFQRPIAAHPLLHEAFVNWEGSPQCPPESRKGSSPNRTGKPGVSSKGFSITSRVHSRCPDSLTTSRSLPSSDCVQAVFRRWPSPFSRSDILQPVSQASAQGLLNAPLLSHTRWAVKPSSARGSTKIMFLLIF